MKINNLKLKIFYLFICLFVYLFITQTINAASLSLSLDPPIIEINTIPPINLTSPLNIQNKSDTPITLQIQIKPFQAKGENAKLEYSGETLEILKYIQILDANQPVEEISLNPQQQKTLSLNINLPAVRTADGSEGGQDYYFSIMFISKNYSPVESSSSINQIGIATNVLLSVGTQKLPQAIIEEFSSRFFFEKGPAPFIVRVKNTGTHFIKPKGEITIKNMFGQTIGKLDLPVTNVLSDSIRTIPTALWKENFLLGLYTATLNISMSDDEGPVFTRSIRFLAFPFQALSIFLIIVIAIIVIKDKLKLYMNKNRT